jgi:hypothetical protein
MPPDHEHNDISGIEDVAAQQAADPDDADGWGFKVLADVGLQIGRLSDTTDRLNDNLHKLRARESQFPIRHKSVKANPVAAGVNLVLSHGSPQQGRRWNVRAAATGGVTPTTAAVGAAYLFKTGMNPALDQANPMAGLDALFDIHPSFPYADTYGDRDVTVEAGESIICIIVGGTTGQVYISTLTIDDFPMVPMTDNINA